MAQATDSSSSSTKQIHPKKRIIVCCDGTWMDSDGDVQIPSNVTRICRCLKTEGVDPETKKPIPQIIYYQSGVGTGDSLYSKYVGGATGNGLAEHIREGYGFVCNNYQDGDEIFIIGFSRGAFTARSISSLIRAVGLLTRSGMGFFYEIFEDWEYQLKTGWTTRFPDEPWPHRPALNTPEYRHKLLELELTRVDIPIKCVAVWDTVGALGIPMIGLLPQPPSKDFSFVDTKVEKNIEYAFQALALDEHRRSYAPTIWEKPTGQAWPKVLKQTWFPGVHSDVGGSYANMDLANITLAWMISQLDPLLAFDHSYVVQQNRLSMERHVKHKKPVRPWGLGKIHDSMTLFFRLGGVKIRTPSEYLETDPATGKRTSRYLENTKERVHSSVRIRMGKKGLGYNDKGTYDSDALKGWVLHGTEVSPSQLAVPGAAGRMKNVVWRKTVGSGKTQKALEMPEDDLGDLEHQIMEAWPEIFEEFSSIRPGGHQAVVKRASTYPADLAKAEAAGARGGQEVSENGMKRPERIETF